MGALIRHADSGRGTFPAADRMIVRIQCAVAFGSWQFGAGISCQRVAEPMKSLCQGENASASFRHYFLSFSLRLPLPPLHHSVLSFSHSLVPSFSLSLSHLASTSGVEEGIISGNSTGMYGCARRIAQCVLTCLNIAFQDTSEDDGVHDR